MRQARTASMGSPGLRELLDPKACRVRRGYKVPPGFKGRRVLKVRKDLRDRKEFRVLQENRSGISVARQECLS